MRKVKLAAFAALSLFVSSGIAAAAGVPATWTGWYVGFQGGLATAQSSQTNTLTNVSNGLYTLNGGLLGGTLGYNWQINKWVVGAEADYAWANIKGQETDCGPAHKQVCPIEIRGFGTLRGRVGYLVFDSVLAYVTGGLAYAEVKAYKEGVAVTGGDDWRATWTLGTGAEVMLLPNWSVKVEYLYTTFSGTQTTYTITASNTPVAAQVRDVHMVRAGLNWHF